jgi:hypothetical protein
MNKLISLLLSFSLCCPSYGACDKPVTYLEQGQSTTCNGYLFTIEKEKEVRLKLMDYDLMSQELQLKNKKLDNILKELTITEEIADKERKKGELWRARAVDSTEKLVSTENGRGARDLLFFVGGMLSVLLGAWAVGKVK